MQPHFPEQTPKFKVNQHFNPPEPDRTLSVGEPAEPLLGVLPIKRWIPQDVHSVMDYVDGLTVASGFFFPQNKRDDAACWASVGLAAGVIGVSLLSDYRLSLAKVIPIRAHETADYLWGAACIALPFALGYWKKSPRVAWTHIAVGAGTILASLFTDYRSYRAEAASHRARKAVQSRSQADIG